MPRSLDLSSHKTSFDHYDLYGIGVSHVGATGDLSNAPYADLFNATVTGGTARPYKGDKSVYTSEEDVLINIKDPAATAMYLQKKGATSRDSIPIDGNTQINVKEKCKEHGDGIYYVWTGSDEGAIRESFEYVTVKSINYTITNGKLSFDENSSFWYAWCKMSGNEYYPNTLKANVPFNEGNDYSNWAEVCDMEEVITIFCKGEYGAYTAPVGEATIIDATTETDIAVDDTLSVEGMAADAKAVGDKLGDIETAMGNVILHTQQELTEDQKAQARENIGAAAPAVEKQYELIEDITLDDDVTKFERTKCPVNEKWNGEAYNFSAITIVVDVAKNPNASTNVQLIFDLYGDNANNMIYYQVNGAIATSAKTTALKARNDHGKIDYQVASGSTSTISTKPAVWCKTWKNVNKFILTSYPTENVIPAGTRIRIYAIRG